MNPVAPAIPSSAKVRGDPSKHRKTAKDSGYDGRHRPLLFLDIHPQMWVIMWVNN
jgi:hypothetical protein